MCKHQMKGTLFPFFFSFLFFLFFKTTILLLFPVFVTQRKLFDGALIHFTDKHNIFFYGSAWHSMPSLFSLL